MPNLVASRRDFWCYDSRPHNNRGSDFWHTYIRILLPYLVCDEFLLKNLILFFFNKCIYILIARTILLYTFSVEVCTLQSLEMSSMDNRKPAVKPANINVNRNTRIHRTKELFNTRNRRDRDHISPVSNGQSSSKLPPYCCTITQGAHCMLTDKFCFVYGCGCFEYHQIIYVWNVTCYLSANAKTWTK